MFIEVKTLELIGKKKVNKKMGSDIDYFYESCLCFFSAKNYYEYGKKYIIAELDTDLFKFDSIKIGEFYDVKFYCDTVFYYGLTVITDVYSSDSTPDLKYNSIYDFKVLPESKKKRKKRKKKVVESSYPPFLDEDDYKNFSFPQLIRLQEERREAYKREKNPLRYFLTHQ